MNIDIKYKDIDYKNDESLIIMNFEYKWKKFKIDIEDDFFYIWKNKLSKLIEKYINKYILELNWKEINTQDFINWIINFLNNKIKNYEINKIKKDIENLKGEYLWWEMLLIRKDASIELVSRFFNVENVLNDEPSWTLEFKNKKFDVVRFYLYIKEIKDDPYKEFNQIIIPWEIIREKWWYNKKNPKPIYLNLYAWENFEEVYTLKIKKTKFFWLIWDEKLLKFNFIWWDEDPTRMQKTQLKDLIEYHREDFKKITLNIVKTYWKYWWKK